MNQDWVHRCRTALNRKSPFGDENGSDSMKYWKVIADRLHVEGWSYGIAEHFTKHGSFFESLDAVGLLPRQRFCEKRIWF